MRNFLIHINFISLIVLISNKSINYRCGTNELKIKPKKISPKFSVDKNDLSNKRRLDDIDEDGFKSFNIYVDKSNLEKDIVSFKLQKYRDIIINSMDKATNTLQKLLRVKPLEYGYQFSNDELNDIGIYNWDKEKFGDYAIKKRVDMQKLGIDLVIFATITEMEDGVVAAAIPVITQTSNNQPICGILYINNKINFGKINSQKYLESTLIHEMTHILGFSITFFKGKDYE